MLSEILCTISNAIIHEVRGMVADSAGDEEVPHNREGKGEEEEEKDEGGETRRRKGKKENNHRRKEITK